MSSAVRGRVCKDNWIKQMVVFAILFGLLMGGCSQKEGPAGKNPVQYRAVELQIEASGNGENNMVYSVKQGEKMVGSFSVSEEKNEEGLRLGCVLKHGDKPIYKEEECFGLSIEKAFRVDENLVLLLAVGTGGNACPVYYAFLTLKPNGEVKLSKEFGNCLPAREVRTEDGSIVVKIPSYYDSKLFVYRDGDVEEKPDPEFAEADAKTIEPEVNKELALKLLKVVCTGKVGLDEEGRLECKPCPSFTSFGRDSVIEDELAVEEIYRGNFYPNKNYYIVRYSGCEPNSNGSGGYYILEETKKGLRFVNAYNESAGKCMVKTKDGRDYLQCTLGECHMKTAGRLDCKFIDLGF